MSNDKEYKIILFILDGIADCAYPQLNNLTPLQYAKTPVLNRFADLSICGIMSPLTPGLALSSELAHFLLFGYRLPEFPNRGVFEAAGEDIDLEIGDVACRVNLVQVKKETEQLTVIDREPLIPEDNCRQLFESIERFESNNIFIDITYTDKNQGIIKLKGDVSSDITDSDPFQVNLPVIKVQALKSANQPEFAIKTSQAINQFLRSFHLQAVDYLEENNLNLPQKNLPFLLTKWAGQKTNLKKFNDKYGLKGASIASSAVLKGLAKEIDINYVKINQHMNSRKDLKNKIIKAFEISNDFDFFHIHSKLADEASHKMDPELKVSVIEGFDQALIDLSDKFDDDKYIIIITSDHATPCWGQKIHSGENVPIAIKGKYVSRDKVQNYNEIDCAQGGLGLIKGRDLMPIALNFSGRAKLQSLKPTAEESLVRPEKLVPFSLDNLD